MAFNSGVSSKNLLFVGPQGTGKSSILTSLPNYQIVLYMDLEDPLLVRDLLKNPALIRDVIEEVKPSEWLMINRIDRIVKYIPDLITAIKEKNIFIAATTGSLTCFHNQTDLELFEIKYFSSMRYSQIEKTMSLNDILSYGTLPQIYNLEKSNDRIQYLKNYTQEFLDMEILFKSKVRNLVPFHLFLPLASSAIGTKLNFSAMAEQLETDHKTVQNYFNLLTENNVAFYLPPYSKNLKRGQSLSSKFYFFDSGFLRAVTNQIDSPVVEGTEDYYLLFKNWCIAEVIRIVTQNRHELKLSQLETKNGVTIDLIIEDQKGGIWLINFQCASKILPRHLKSLKNVGSLIPQAQLFYVTTLTENKLQDGVNIISYDQFFNQKFRTVLSDN